MTIVYWREKFPRKTRDWDEYSGLLDRHADEVRGKPFTLNRETYLALEQQSLLGIFTARENGVLVGYSWHILTRSLHDNVLIGRDDLWYVEPAHRGKGIGSELRSKGLAWMLVSGAIRADDFVRERPGAAFTDTILRHMGYQPIGTFYSKHLHQEGPADGK